MAEPTTTFQETIVTQTTHHDIATTPLKSGTEKMLAVEWHAATDVRVVERPKPMITKPTDAIVRVRLTTICGSDLHLYHKEINAMEKGDVLGHEAVGIVEEIGGSVTKIKKGERVTISAVIACGNCDYCKKELFSCCDATNPSKDMEDMYGHRLAGIFGYSHLTGAYDGTQAEFVRVPIADVNLLPVPKSMRDETAILLSDVACTAWHGCEMGEVKEGDIVGIWGCGPIGLMTAAWAKHRRAGRVISIDCIPERLRLAENLGVDTINFAETDVLQRLRELTNGGLDVSIDTVGFRYTKSIRHKLQKSVMLETDAVDVLDEAIRATKKGGHLSILGDYVGWANNFPIGAMMEKSLTIRGGQLHPQKYWPILVPRLLKTPAEGGVDTSFLWTHRFPLREAAKAYRMFDRKEDGCVKIALEVSVPLTDDIVGKQ